MMLYDFKFPRPTLTEFCFRFIPAEQEGPFSDGPFTAGEVKVWLFVAEQWSGPYSVGIGSTYRHFVPSSESDLTMPERLALHQAIYERKHWLMDVQRTIDTPPDRLTGKLLMEEYYRRYPLPKQTPGYELIRT